MKTLHSLFPWNRVRYRKSNWHSARSYPPLEQQTGKSQNVSDVDYKMKPVSSFIHIWSVKWLKVKTFKRLKQWRLWQLYLFLSVWPLLLLKVRLFLLFFLHFTNSAQSVASLFQNNHFHHLFLSSSREARDWNPKMLMSWGWSQNGEAKADRESWNSPY